METSLYIICVTDIVWWTVDKAANDVITQLITHMYGNVLSSEKIKKLGKFVTSQITSVQGDPGHLNSAKRKVQSTILSDGCPTHWSTYAFNDTNLTDLHNHNVMPYSMQRTQ